MNLCAAPRCTRVVYGHGWCNMHYLRWKRTGDPLHEPRWDPHRPKPLEERFWAKVDKNGPIPAHRPDLGPCWLWTGRPDGNGYGVFTVGSGGKGGRWAAHRYAWELASGAVPPQKYVLHHCDTRPCVRRYNHLFIGTHADNMEDMARKERTRASVLTAEKVLEIRARAASGETSVQLGPVFGVTPRTIRNVLEGATWRHVPSTAAREEGDDL